MDISNKDAPTAVALWELRGQVDYASAVKDEYIQYAAHTLVYAKSERKVLQTIKDQKIYERAKVLVHMRFDGMLGFPGGLIEGDEDPVEAANREMREEIHLNSSHAVTIDDHIVSNIRAPSMGKNFDRPLVQHFFALPVTMQEFEEIQRNAVRQDENDEVLGNFHVPLYTLQDGYRGLPAFLDNKFAGSAALQFLKALEKLLLLTRNEITTAVKATKRFQQELTQ
jgi:U8 snoRNA-decapping enzyme